MEGRLILNTLKPETELANNNQFNTASSDSFWNQLSALLGFFTVVCGRSVKLTTPLRLVPRLRMPEGVPQITHRPTCLQHST
jgi:hypothetical protein